MKSLFKVYDNFTVAEKEEREERWSLSPIERLNILESLRKLIYEKNRSTPRLQRSIEIIDCPSS